MDERKLYELLVLAVAVQFRAAHIAARQETLKPIKEAFEEAERFVRESEGYDCGPGFAAYVLERQRRKQADPLDEFVKELDK